MVSAVVSQEERRQAGEVQNSLRKGKAKKAEVGDSSGHHPFVPTIKHFSAS